jgi:hypothetical protein
VVKVYYKGKHNLMSNIYKRNETQYKHRTATPPLLKRTRHTSVNIFGRIEINLWNTSDALSLHYVVVMLVLLISSICFYSFPVQSVRYLMWIFYWAFIWKTTPKSITIIFNGHFKESYGTLLMILQHINFAPQKVTLTKFDKTASNWSNQLW